MKLFMYSVYDSAAKTYSNPFCGRTDAEAARGFVDIVSDKKHPFGMHPDCYTLMRCGVWDDNSCEIIPESPVKVINGVEAAAEASKLVQADFGQAQGSA